MKREYWLALVIAGVLLCFSLSWLSLALLLVVPGLAILLSLKERITIAEIVGVSGSLSLLSIPVVTMLISPVSVGFAGICMGLIVIVIGLYGFQSRRNISVDTSDWHVALLAGLIFLIVLAIMAKTFVVGESGLMCATTHASDLNFHLSIAQRFVASPVIPPQDPYLPGYSIVYNWFMQVTMGEIALISGVGLFEVFRCVIALTATMVFVDAVLLARTIFKDDLRASLVGAMIYVASSGLSWLYILYLNLTGKQVDLFKILIYEWKGVMGLKYDSPSLYFFLPQTQTFGLMGLIFGMYLYLVTISKRSWKYAVITGVALASLIFYHMITAFPVLVAAGLFFLYAAVHERQSIFRDKDLRFVTIAAIPLIIAGSAGIFQLLLLSESAGSQVTIGHDADILITLLFSLGPLIPFAIWGMYLAVGDSLSRLFSRKKEVQTDDLPVEKAPVNGAWLLIIYAVLNFIFLNIFQMAMTHNTYRFIVYMAVPVSIFAGLALSKWLFSRKIWKIAIAALIILIMVPSTFAIIMFYNDSAYVHATTADLKALDWISKNTPVNAIFYEEPSHFVRLPLLTGREDAYAGEIYTWQYHNVDKQPEMEAILHMTDREALYKQLVDSRIDYVFVGSKEAGFPFAITLQGIPELTLAYNEDGVKVYKVNRP